MKIRTRFVRTASHESDFKPIYSNLQANPLYYNIAVCPICGFSFTEEFSPYFPPGTQDEIHNRITVKWSGRSFGSERNEDEAIETYKLAYLSAMYKREKAITIAGLLLRIAWLYRDKKYTEEELRFLAMAKNNYINCYSEGDYIGTQMSELRVLYLIAELARRLGDNKEAVRYFSRVLEQQRNSTEPQIIKMARDQWEKMRK